MAGARGTCSLGSVGATEASGSDQDGECAPASGRSPTGDQEGVGGHESNQTPPAGLMSGDSGVKTSYYSLCVW